MIALSHNYPLKNALQVLNYLGAPVVGATVRVFEAVRYNAGDYDDWVGETTTDEDGYWHAPIFVPDGQSWVVHIQKLHTYGPVVIRIDANT